MEKTLKSLLILSTLFFFSPHTVMAESYPVKAGGKMINGIANVATGFVEIPKTMIIASRSEGPVYGVTAGFILGIMQMTARTLYGALNVATFMIPTKSLINPDYVWKDLDEETTYDSDLQIR